MKAYFVSDIHLLGPGDPRIEVFERFLESLLQKGPGDDKAGASATHLFLVGDIFDLWIGRHSYFLNAFAGVVSRVESLVKSGVEVHFFEGNHDLYLKEFWQQRLGVRVHEEPVDLQLGSLCVRIEHGDLINPDDRGYLFLRWFLRTSVMRIVARLLPSPLIRFIGQRSSRMSRRYSAREDSHREEKIRAMLRRHAENLVAQKPYDLLISGHVHVRDQQTIRYESREAQAINLGSWFDEPMVLRLTDTTLQFLRVQDICW